MPVLHHDCAQFVRSETSLVYMLASASITQTTIEDSTYILAP
jgi:hypothetical protein